MTPSLVPQSELTAIPSPITNPNSMMICSVPSPIDTAASVFVATQQQQQHPAATSSILYMTPAKSLQKTGTLPPPPQQQLIRRSLLDHIRGDGGGSVPPESSFPPPQSPDSPTDEVVNNNNNNSDEVRPWTVTSRTTIDLSTTTTTTTPRQRRLLLRHQSEPMTTTTTSTTSSPTSTTDALCGSLNDINNKRRLIFPSFWQSQLTNSSTDDPQDRYGMIDRTPQQHRRSRSMSMLPLLLPPEPRQQQQQYLYPRRSAGSSHNVEHQQKHYRIIEHEEDVACLLSSLHLPVLPSPMARLRKHGGVYPLMQPCSILRNHNGAIHSSSDSKETGSSNTTTLQCLSSSTQLCDITPPPLPFRDDHEETDTDTGHGIDDSTDSSRCDEYEKTRQQQRHEDSSAKVLGCGKVVHFDPRVTVTELADHGYVRCWYEDYEIEKFRSETVEVARRYLMQHPNLIPLYRDVIHDPVTRSFRHRPLFGLPALSDVSLVDDDEEKAEGIQLGKDEVRLLTSLASVFGYVGTKSTGLSHTEHSVPCSPMPTRKQQGSLIRRIMIVDSNPRILDLFKRSLQTMCKLAKCMDDVDIRCARDQQTALQYMQYHPKETEGVTSQSPHQPPFDVVICEEPCILTTTMTEGTNSEDIEQSLFGWVPERERILLIVTCTHYHPSNGKVTTSSFVDADLVWTKPPPRMDAILHTQLCEALRTKRSRSKLTESIDDLNTIAID